MGRDVGLKPIGFHECRHTFISTMIASGLNAKAVSILAGHASIVVTYDTYGHLFRGHEDEAGKFLAEYYVKAEAKDQQAVPSDDASLHQGTVQES